MRGSYTYISRRATLVLRGLRHGDSRGSGYGSWCTFKEVMSPERLFTLLELAVVQRERSVFLAGRGDVRRKRTGKERAQEAYRRRTRHIVLQLTRNKECWIILAGTVFQSAAGTCVLEGSSCVLSPRNCPFLVRRENGTASVT